MTDDPTYRRAKRLFLDCCELPAPEREQRIRDECAADPELERQVRSLLAHHLAGTGSSVSTDVPHASADVGTDATIVDRGLRGERSDQQIGPYTVKSILGRGGQGTVYLAEKLEGGVRLRVALKVLSDPEANDSFLARFDRERRILAGLKHDAIAGLHDAGQTEDGRPWFAMELVEGVPIDQYCDDKRLDIEDRLEIFGRVCEAVQYAHGAQIVHRDLKPANILVTHDGRPKLLDFGIARYTNPILAQMEEKITVDRSRPMTPEYASPEQVRGDVIIGAASDVYSLGVILFELLSGHAPYRLRSRVEEEIRRVILDEAPQRPSAAVQTTEFLGDPDDPSVSTITPDTVSKSRSRRPVQLRRRLEGDLDNIVLMALRKEADRRYPTAHALAEDIQRHLDGMPVTARPDTLSYRTGKFVRRHRFGVGSAAAILVIIVGSLITTINLWNSADSERAAAELAQTRAEQQFRSSWDFTRYLLLEIDPQLQVLIGGQKIRESIADQAVKRLQLDSLVAFADDAEPDFAFEVAQGLRIMSQIAGSPRSESGGDLPAAMDLLLKSIAVLDAANTDGITPEALDEHRYLRGRLHRDLGVLYMESGITGVALAGISDSFAAAKVEFLAALSVGRQLVSNDPDGLAPGRLLMISMADLAKLARSTSDETAFLEMAKGAESELARLRTLYPDDPTLFRDAWHSLNISISAAKYRSDYPAYFRLAERQLGFARQMHDQEINTRTVRDLGTTLGTHGSGATKLARQLQESEPSESARYANIAIADLDEAIELLTVLTVLNNGVDRDDKAMIDTYLKALIARQAVEGAAKLSRTWECAREYAELLARMSGTPTGNHRKYAIILISSAAERWRSHDAADRADVNAELEATLLLFDGWRPADRARFKLMLSNAEQLLSGDRPRFDDANTLVNQVLAGITDIDGEPADDVPLLLAQAALIKLQTGRPDDPGLIRLGEHAMRQLEERSATDLTAEEVAEVATLTKKLSGLGIGG